MNCATVGQDREDDRQIDRLTLKDGYEPRLSLKSPVRTKSGF